MKRMISQPPSGIKYFQWLAVLCILTLASLQLHAGGGCTFSNTCGSATSLTCGTNYSMSNSSCDANSLCCGCWAGCAGTCDICDSPPAHSEDCSSTVMGISCFISGTFCGSPENTQWARFCPTTTGSYAFNFSTISCSGGGASLQFAIYNAGVTCANNEESNNMDCAGSLTGSSSASYSLTAGQCYLMVFDGNAGATCTWNFSITCVPLAAEIQSFDANFVSGRSIRLDWATLAELNSKEFFIKRRYDNLSRESGKTADEQYNDLEHSILGPIPVKGNATTGASYQYMDNSVNMPGIYYYELYERELDGTQRLQGKTEVYVNTPEESAITSAYYNSISNMYNMEFDVRDPAPVSYNLYSSDGKLVDHQYMGQQAAGHHTVVMDLDKLSPGVYVVDLKIGAKSFQKKFLVK